MARGNIRKRSKNSYEVSVVRGWVKDSTGKRKYKRHYETIKGTKRDAEDRLTELNHKAKHHTLTEPSKISFGEWLDTWLELAIKPPQREPGTYESYRRTIDLHLKPKLGQLLLQKLDDLDLEQYYNEKGEKLTQRTLKLHHAVISGALKSAQKKRYVERNVATLVENKPIDWH